MKKAIAAIAAVSLAAAAIYAIAASVNNKTNPTQNTTQPQTDRVVKILCIGNSFSQDATRYLEDISDGRIFVRNLYIGGCTLEIHNECIESGKALYEYQKDAEEIEKIALEDALRREKWDYITVQQVSNLSGIEESYEPYLSNIIEFVKSICPDAEIVLHSVWPYDHNTKHHGFAEYNNSQSEMFERMQKCTKKFSEKHSLRVVNTGKVVQRLRSTPEFNYETGGLSLTRDTYHMSDYGRYLTGLVWNEFFTGTKPTDVKYVPDGFDEKLVDVLKTGAAG